MQPGPCIRCGREDHDEGRIEALDSREIDQDANAVGERIRADCLDKEIDGD